ncbi:MAG: tetratricopeptide repeat protein [Proteobacteria bacterium]|nr:tetratricopeptide repeat protein [Pseudomonadota bacterium]
MRFTQMAFGSVLTLFSALAYLSSESFSANGFNQIVIPFKSEKEFTYEWLKKENTLRFQFPGTSPEELEPFNHYDERLVRRMVVKDLGPSGTEVQLVLKDRDVRALVSSFHDPFRVSIDLFDKNYAPKKDLTTGLPLIEDGLANDGAVHSHAASNHGAGAKKERLEDSDTAGIEAPKQQVSGTPQPSSNSKRRLLQALPDELQTQGELKVAMEKISPGVGKGWLTYPPYIYRAQLAPFEGREAPAKEFSNLAGKALVSSSGMAEYASKLYDFGHEGRALAAYQQVLLKEPGVFEKDPVHLWKFAECHLGQGNFQLAEGYYSSLLDKHSTHPLAKFAQLRKLDVAAIKAIQKQDQGAIAELGLKVKSAVPRASAEVNAQALIRQAWWTDANASQERSGKLPLANEEIQRTLTTLLPNVESQRTAFLASSLIAHRMTQKETSWESSYANWLNEFFSKFKGPGVEPIRTQLSDATKLRIANEIKTKFSAGDYIGLVSMFEKLPEPMKSIRKDPSISWAIGESYRMNGQAEKSIPYYKIAKDVPLGIDRFKAQFWLMDIAGSVAMQLQANGGSQDKIRNLSAVSSESDEALNTTWAALKSDERSQIQTGMNQHLEKNVASSLKSKTPAKILLDKWSTTLTVNPPKVSATNGNNPANEVGNFSPSATTVQQLDELGKKFADIGLTDERRKALELMRFIQPAAIEKDKQALKVWSSQLLSLAEEYRKSNEFLEAGQLYTLVGDSQSNQENRAEANYKGGLLLYRAGRKDDAIKALEKAKSDTNNLFYSKLATERLDQIQAH